MNKTNKGSMAGAIAATVAGFLALVWFLVRVVPKPNRALYPCQQVAAPVAAGFVAWLLSLAGSALAFRQARSCARQRRFLVVGFCVVAGVCALLANLILSSMPVSAAFEPVDGSNQPIGIGRGVQPGRVVWAHDTAATSWDGRNGYWWGSNHTDTVVVDRMVSDTIRALTGAADDRAAWQALFRQFNRDRGREAAGYRRGEQVAIKVNMNAARSPEEDNREDQTVSPQVVCALIGQLVRQADVDEGAIAVCDPSRYIGPPMRDLCRASFPRVRFVDRIGANGCERAEPDLKAAIHFAGTNVAYSGKTYVARCIGEADYLINCAVLRGHSIAGMTGCAKNLFGTIWKDWQTNTWHHGWTPMADDPMQGLHGFIAAADFQEWFGTFSGRPTGSYTPLPELMGHRQLGGKTLLFVVDGLYASLHQSRAYPMRWQSAPFRFNGQPHWTSSLFASQDGVAIDSVTLDVLRSEPRYGRVLRGAVDNYLHEAAQADRPPSGARYDPEGDGTVLASLGTHEHWNNAVDRKYSRNLGRGQGIELVFLDASVSNAPPRTVGP